jgi:hypothetical protein
VKYDLEPIRNVSNICLCVGVAFSSLPSLCKSYVHIPKPGLGSDRSIIIRVTQKFQARSPPSVLCVGCRPNKWRRNCKTGSIAFSSLHYLYFSLVDALILEGSLLTFGRRRKTWIRFLLPAKKLHTVPSIISRILKRAPFIYNIKKVNRIYAVCLFPVMPYAHIYPTTVQVHHTHVNSKLSHYKDMYLHFSKILLKN